MLVVTTTTMMTMMRLRVSNSLLWSRGIGLTGTDIDDILYTCGFASTTYVASAASAAVSGVSVDATRPTDASQLTTTIVAGATRTQGGGSASNTGSNNNNNDASNTGAAATDASATNDASSPDETNAAAAMAPAGFVGAVIGAAMLLA